MGRIIILLIIGALVIFVAGGAIGIFYQTQMGTSLIKNPQVIAPSVNPVVNNIIKTLSSKLVSSINSYGKVSKIDGINVTLTSQGESLTIQVKENVPIFTYVQTLPLKKGDISNMVQKELNLKDIKNGDSLDVSLKLLPDGQLEAKSIYVIPPPAQDAKK